MEWLIWAALLGVALVLVYAALDRLASPPRQAVLPAQYDPTNYATGPSSIPGRCVRCGRRNDPDYRYCGNCAGELPDADSVSAAARSRPFGRE
ncbi:zinc ribbon domain-containing protein [Saliphagus infecundisoli]|uniref:Zinc ribbon domain-containing protein n=1 Tax=Saliphagus infecundisoli TaxID=1849069 RepID=A0ABD5QI50_9EURY|nr:zinc ribbon domain-containing protein [Saliphagus infecundisoli]